MATSIESSTSQRSGSSELFTDLDPLGTGRSRPYYDKKDFFTDFKPTTTRSGADSGSGPSSLASQPSGPAPLAPTASSMSTPAQLTSSEQLFGRSFSSNENRQLPTTGISAPPSSQTSRSGSGSRPLYGYIQGFGFSEYLTESHPSDRNVSTPRPTAGQSSSLNRSAANQMQLSAWGSQDTQIQDGSQPSSFSASEFAQDNIYEVCGEGSSSLTAVEITLQSSPNSLQVNLPPDVSADTDPASGGGYGSIPHLDASPRRYRYIDNEELSQSESPSSSLNVPNSNRYGGSFSQATGSNDLNESPPKLPERAPKTSHSGAPPPLPPKKPLSNQSSKTSIKNVTMNNVALMAACFAESARSDDIYDFVPEPIIGNVSMNQEEAKQCISDILKAQQPRAAVKAVLPDLGSVSIEELSRMSVMELNEKMTAGLLPEELTGMSIFELVEFVAKHMRLKKELDEDEKDTSLPPILNDSQQSNSMIFPSTSMKPSFSDNFITEKLLSTPKAEPSSIVMKQTTNTNDIISGLSIQPLTSIQQSISLTKEKGFEDDFAHFQLPTSSISGRESSVSDSMTEQEREAAYDKYAVFRELQMEEELLRAWKTPSEEEKADNNDNDDNEDNNENNDNNENEDNDDEDEEDEEKSEIDDEDEEKAEAKDLMAHEEEEQLDSQEQPICSSEGSPRSRSDTGSLQKSVSEDGTLDDLRIGSEVGEGSLDAHGSDHHDPKRESQIPIFFVEEGNEGDEMSEEETEKVGEIVEPQNTEATFDFDSHSSVAVAEVEQQPRDPVVEHEPQPDANKFEHNFDEAFGPAGDLTITKDWTTFDDGPMEGAAVGGGAAVDDRDFQNQDLFQDFSLEDQKQRELEFERLKEQELRQQEQLYDEHQRLQEELQHQHALQRELQFHQQELNYHQQELQLQQEQQHQQHLRYQLLSDTIPNPDESVRTKFQIEKHLENVMIKEHYSIQQQQLLLQQQQQQQQVTPTVSSGERRNSHLARRLQEEASIAANQYSSSEGSGNNSPMMRIVGDRRVLQAQQTNHHVASHHRGGNPHYVNTHGHHQPYLHHPSHAQYPLQYSHSGRCLENHHWELVAHEKPYEDPRYQPEYMSSFGNGGRNRTNNRSRHQSNSSEVWNTMEEERRQPQSTSSRVQLSRGGSSAGMHSGVGSPFNDNFTSQSRGSPSTNTPSSLKLGNEGTWASEDATAPPAPALNGRRSVGQNSCPGDFAMAPDSIFDSSKDILSGASFKVLARVIPNAGQLLDGQQQLHQLSLPNSDDGSDIPKSNSVNIFTIKDDPFADDFFQH